MHRDNGKSDTKRYGRGPRRPHPGGAQRARGGKQSLFRLDQDVGQILRGLTEIEGRSKCRTNRSTNFLRCRAYRAKRSTKRLLTDRSSIISTVDPRVASAPLILLAEGSPLQLWSFSDPLGGASTPATAGVLEAEGSSARSAVIVGCQLVAALPAH